MSTQKAPVKHNPKRRIRSGCTPAQLNSLAGNISYDGSGQHKKNPGDFGVIPTPRPDKSLCDDVNIFERSKAEDLLKKGAKKGLISEQMDGGYPQNIWSATPDGEPLEAQLTNREQGTYHGYPMRKHDPLAEEVMNRLEES